MTETVTGTCHCGATRFTIPVPAEATACTCTFCTKRGALWAYYWPREVTIEKAEHRGTWGAETTNKHHFCTVCGCGTWSEAPDWTAPDPFAPEAQKVQFNIRLLDDFDIASVPVTVIDGRNLW